MGSFQSLNSNKIDPKVYEKTGGHFVSDHESGQILTFKCKKCFDHMSLWDYKIKDGVVSSDVICPTCGTVYIDLRFENTISKDKGDAFIK